MTDMSFFSRLREARFFRTLLVYLGGSWAVLEVSGFLVDRFGYPDWLITAMLALLAVGLAMLIATAWTRALPTRERQEDEESVVRGFRLTWGRWALGAVMATSLLIGFSGLYALLSEREPEFPIILDSAAGPAIAVLPFSVAGTERELWDEGMVDLLYYNLDGAAGYRAIHPRLLMSRWQAEGGDERIATSDERRLAFARSLGASHALWGNVTETGSYLRLTAELHEVQGDAVYRAQAEGPTDSITAVLDRLCIELMRSGLVGDSEVPEFDLAHVTTTSYPALVAYLEAERLHRRSRLREAIAAYQRAVEADPDLGIAYHRIVWTSGWTHVYAASADKYEERLSALIDRLPQRTKQLLGAIDMIMTQWDPSGFDMLEEYVASYPDDVEGWYVLGERLFHWQAQVWMIPHAAERSRAALRRATELDPGFGPAYFHLIDDAVRWGNRVALERLIEGHRRLDPESPTARGLALLWGLTSDDSTARWRAYASLDTSSLQAVGMAHNRLLHAPHLYPDALMATSRALQDPKNPSGVVGNGLDGEWVALFAQGRIAEVRKMQEEDLGPRRLFYLYNDQLIWYLIAYPYLPASREVLDFFVQYSRGSPRLAVGLAAVALEDWDEFEAQVRKLDSWIETPPGNYKIETIRKIRETMLAYAELRQGNLESARAGLERGLPGLSHLPDVMQLEFGRLLIELGDLEEAEQVLTRIPSARTVTPVEYYLGEIYRLRGDYETARLHYGRFVAAWENADPELQPWRESALRTLESLIAE